MNTTAALKTTDSFRISYGRRWMYFDKDIERWVVREHGYGKKNTTILQETESEEQAVEALLKENTWND